MPLKGAPRCHNGACKIAIKRNFLGVKAIQFYKWVSSSDGGHGIGQSPDAPFECRKVELIS